MRARITELIEHVADPRKPWAFMQDTTGISRLRWQGVARGTQHANEEMLAALGEHWPKFAYWLVTGLTDEANGHISPALERIARDLQTIRKAG